MTKPVQPIFDCGGVDSDTRHGDTASGRSVGEVGKAKRDGRLGLSLTNAQNLGNPRAPLLAGSECNSRPQSPSSDARIALAVLLAVPVGVIVGALLSWIFIA